MDAIYYQIIFIVLLMSSSESNINQHNRHGLVACDRPGGVNGERRWHKHLWVANENDYSQPFINEENPDRHTEDQINTHPIQSSSSEFPPSAQKQIHTTTTPVTLYPLTRNDINPAYVPFSHSDHDPRSVPTSDPYSYTLPKASPTYTSRPPFVQHEAVKQMCDVSSVSLQMQGNDNVFLPFNPPRKKCDTSKHDCTQQRIIVSSKVQNNDFHQLFFEYMHHKTTTFLDFLEQKEKVEGRGWLRKRLTSTVSNKSNVQQHERTVLHALRIVISNHELKKSFITEIDPILACAFDVSFQNINKLIKDAKTTPNIYVMLYKAMKEEVQGFVSKSVSAKKILLQYIIDKNLHSARGWLCAYEK